MFYAFIIACAATNIEVDRSNCLTFGDTRGPYQKIESCSERTQEMISFVSSEGTVRNSIRTVLGWPPFVYVEGICVEDPSEMT